MSYTLKGQKNEFQVTIGCEIHAQVASNSKLFSRSATKFGSAQNSQVSLFDIATPGKLPVINKEAVIAAVKTGLAMGCQINLKSIFDRKNYFYPDLPQGYQISQFSDPIVGQGTIQIDLEDGSLKDIGITRLHIEQDAGKLIHDQHQKYSLVDLNRAGIALMEIVSDPDLSSPLEAAAYVKKIRSILRAIGSCDGNMEKGNLRCDANISVKIIGQKELGTRCEIKNLNSIKNITKAIEYEAKRQIKIIEDGGTINQETRLFNADQGVTKTMRSKEDAMDYRYFPDPDLPPLVISQEFVDQIKANLPELPDAKKKRYISDLGLSSYDSAILSLDEDISNFFEIIIKKHQPKLATNWICVELFARINKAGINFDEIKITAENFTKLLDLIVSGTISGKIAKDVLDAMFETGQDPSKIVEEKGLKQVSNEGEIIKIITQILDENQDKVQQYKSGKDKLFGFFVGQVMKATKGQANPQIVNKLLKENL